MRRVYLIQSVITSIFPKLRSRLSSPKRDRVYLCQSAIASLSHAKIGAA
ncbi:hypothetical protein NDI49_17490 [Trichocoleus sp. ST-U3]